ncbi:MAG: hypothetical protein ACK56I_10660, partial [bacterium]
MNQASLINNSVYGSFSGPNKHELILTKGAKILEMQRLDENTGKLQVVFRQECFGVIRKVI